MDLGVREVRQAAGVVKMKVCHHDVADGLGRVAEAGDLADGRLVRVVMNAEVNPEEANDGRRRHVVVQS
jgi:hypothetical protein